jgi:Amt family ammonium transporter
LEQEYLVSIWQFGSIAAVLLTFAGFAALEVGLVRPKNTAAVAGAKLGGALACALVFATVGGRIMFRTSSMQLYQLAIGCTMAMTASSIATGAVAERMSFRAQLALVGLAGGLVFPAIARWGWIGGWLASRHFLDAGGATVVHAFAGATALGAVIVVGPRKARFGRGGEVRKIPGSSAALAVAGVITIWVGWVGWVVPGAVPPLGHMVLASSLAASAGGIVGLAGSAFRGGRVHVDVGARGLVAGLVGCSAMAPLAGAPLALVAGAVAALVMLLVDLLLARLRVDDATGVVGVHLGGGLVGTAAAGFIAHADFAVQLEGFAVCAGVAGAAAIATVLVTRLVMRIRVSADEEAEGLNVAIHGVLPEGADVAPVEVDVKFEPVAPSFEAFAEVAHIVVDAEGMVKATNPAASAIFGYAEREFLKGVNALHLFATPRGKAPMDAAGLDKLVGAAVARELAGVRRTGEEFHMEVSVQRTDEGLLSLSMRDITKRKQAEEGLDRALDEIQRRLERELDAAKVTIGSLVPGETVPPPGCELSAHKDRGRFLGTYFSEDGPSIIMFIGDVVDERKSALVDDDEGYGGSDYTHGLLLGDPAYSPARQLKNFAEVLNRIVLETGKGALLVQLSLTMVNLASGEMTWLDAGYPAPVTVKAQGKVVSLIGGDGTALGGTNNPSFLTRDLKLDSGDMVVLATDGITDAYSRSRKPFSARELRRLLGNANDVAALKDQILDRAHLVARDRGDEAHHSVLVFRREAVQTASRRRELPGVAAS